MTRITCPHCSRKGTSSKTVPVGAKVKCPGCGNSFRYEGTGHAVAEISPATSKPFSDAPPESPVVSIPPVISAVTPQLAVSPTESPHQQGNQVVVPERRRTNAMGIAALGLGTLAVLIAWA